MGTLLMMSMLLLGCALPTTWLPRQSRVGGQRAGQADRGAWFGVGIICVHLRMNLGGAEVAGRDARSTVRDVAP